MVWKNRDSSCLQATNSCVSGMQRGGSILSDCHLFKEGLKEATTFLVLSLTMILEGGRVLGSGLITWCP